MVKSDSDSDYNDDTGGYVPASVSHPHLVNESLKRRKITRSGGKGRIRKKKVEYSDSDTEAEFEVNDDTVEDVEKFEEDKVLRGDDVFPSYEAVENWVQAEALVEMDLEYHIRVCAVRDAWCCKQRIRNDVDYINYVMDNINTYQTYENTGFFQCHAIDVHVHCSLQVDHHVLVTLRHGDIPRNNHPGKTVRLYIHSLQRSSTRSPLGLNSCKCVPHQWLLYLIYKTPLHTTLD